MLHIGACFVGWGVVWRWPRYTILSACAAGVLALTIILAVSDGTTSHFVEQQRTFPNEYLFYALVSLVVAVPSLLFALTGLGVVVARKNFINAERGLSVDLDRLEAPFRRTSLYSSAFSGVLCLVAVASAAALLLSPIAGIGAVFAGESLVTSLLVALAVVLGAIVYAFLYYWLAAEVLRLNRVFGVITALFSIWYWLLAAVLLCLAVASTYVALTEAYAPDLETLTSDRGALRVVVITTTVIQIVSSIWMGAIGRLHWSYAMAAFAPKTTRRMLKPLNQTDAGLRKGMNAILGGGLSIPTLARGAGKIVALNTARNILVGLAVYLLFVAGGAQGWAFSLALSTIESSAIRAEVALRAYPFIAAAIVVLILLVALMLTLGARKCLGIARRNARFGLDAVRAEDPRRPTLFLRPFRDDQVQLARRASLADVFALEPKNRELDHILVEEFSWSGPVVAIGRPGTDVLPFGAARTFLSDEDWQREALSLGAAAGEIVIVVDDTPGVQWEIEQVSGEGLRNKTLFLFHPRYADPDANEQVVRQVSDRLACTVEPGKPVLGIWLRSDASPRTLRSTSFGVAAYTLALRDFFRTRAEEERIERSGERRGAQKKKVALALVAAVLVAAALFVWWSVGSRQRATPLPHERDLDPSVATDSATMGQNANNPNGSRNIALERAAQSGNPIAQYQLARLQLAAGRTQEGVTLLRTVADRGFAMAQYHLAKLYERGEGVPPDLTHARQWTQRAAASGNRRAMHDLGVYFARGEGGPLDEAAAFRLFQQAAELGVSDSQYNLAVLYQQGRGVSANDTEALFWFLVAARQGDRDADTRAAAIEEQLTPAQAEQALSRAEAFRPRIANALANGEFGPQPWDAQDR